MEKFAKNYGIFICVLLVLATLFCLIFGAVFFGEAAKIKNSELPENTGDSIGTAVAGALGAGLAIGLSAAVFILFGFILMIVGLVLVVYTAFFIKAYVKSQKGYSTKVTDVITIILFAVSFLSGISVASKGGTAIAGGIAVMVFSLLVEAYAVTSLKCDKKRISKKNAPRQPAPVADAGVSTSDNDDGEDYEEEEFIEADDIYFTDDVDDDDYEN